MIGREERSRAPSIEGRFEETHTRKDGTYVILRAEEIWNDVNARVVEEQTKLSQQFSPGGSSQQSVELGTPAIDRIFEQVMIYIFSR